MAKIVEKCLGKKINTLLFYGNMPKVEIIEMFKHVMG